MSKDAFDQVFGVDEDLAVNGVWVNYGPMSILITHAGDSNRPYMAALERETRPHRRDIQNETIDEEVASEMMMKVYASTIVKGWKLREGDKYKNVVLEPFSREACLRRFKQGTTGKNFFREMTTQAQRIANFRKAEVEEDAGN